MDPLISRIIIAAAAFVMGVLRAPHARRSREVGVIRTDETWSETALVALAWTGFLLPVIWVVSPILAFADYPSRPVSIGLGGVLLAAGLWVFYLSHTDLGTNWSITVELRQDHRLVTRGIYAHVRHPMYLSLFLYSCGQALAVPNLVAGPSYLVSFATLYLCRVRAEERMMLDAFGDDYRHYMACTHRLLPRLRRKQPAE
jgi:protein-S-isoprenylcysteine O-methyltransferase Ste14